MKIFCDIAQGVLLLCAVIPLTALLMYEKRHRVESKGVRQQRNADRDQGSDNCKVIRKWLRILCVISYVLCICTVVNSLVMFNFHFQSDSACTAPRNMAVSLVTTLDLSIYLFLWLRQYLVYKSINLWSTILRRAIRVLQWGTLFLMVAIFLTSTGLVVRYRRYVYNATLNECIRATPALSELAISYIWIFGSLVLHCCLVFMFGFPLLKVAVSNRGNSIESNQESQRRMMSLIRRCFIVSISIVATDFSVMLLATYAFPGDELSQLRHVLYNTNVLLNCTLIVVSFKEWRAMFCPCFSMKEQLLNGTTQASTTNVDNITRCSA